MCSSLYDERIKGDGVQETKGLSAIMMRTAL